MSVGRPRKHREGYSIRPVMVPKEEEHIWEKAKELADREGNTSISEIVNKALAQYVGEHYPGNPQVPLEVARTETLMQDYLMRKAIARFKGVFSIKWESDHAKTKAVEKALSLALKVRHPTEELLSLMEKATREAE